MLTLGVETSGRKGSVALCRDGRCLEERSLQHLRRRHAQTLVVEVDALFRKFELQPGECEMVAVSLGPGSFTGLRVGVVFAKTFAYATGCSAVGVDTFQAVAENSPRDVTSVRVIEDAQRGDLFVGKYRRERDGGWKRVGKIDIVKADGWIKKLKSDDRVSGPGVDKIEETIAGKGQLLEPAFRFPKARIVALLGERKLEMSGADDIWSLEPFYLRKSAAEEKWEAKHLKG